MVEINEPNRELVENWLKKNTIVVKSPQGTSYELPESLDPHNVQYYCHETKELARTQIEKARKFIENNCIQYDREEKCYKCLPIEGYNTRTYTIKWNKKLKSHECNCQGFQKRLRTGEYPTCSHVLALHFHWKIKNWLGKYEKTKH